MYVVKTHTHVQTDSSCLKNRATVVEAAAAVAASASKLRRWRREQLLRRAAEEPAGEEGTDPVDCSRSSTAVRARSAGARGGRIRRLKST